MTTDITQSLVTERIEPRVNGNHEPRPPLPAVPKPGTDWLSWGLTTENGSLHTIAEYLAYAAFADGREPYAHSVAIDAFKKGETWELPEGGRILRSVESRNFAVQVVVGDGWTLELAELYARKAGGPDSAPLSGPVSTGLYI